MELWRFARTRMMETKDRSFIPLLAGGDLRTLGQSSTVVKEVHDQDSFDELFHVVLGHERLLVMRAVDSVEKITRKHPEFLSSHKTQLLAVLKSADHKELKWHIAQLVVRLKLTREELLDVWHLLSYWAFNKNESKIVRVNALQGLFDLAKDHAELREDLAIAMKAMEREMVPSIQARIRKLKKLMQKQ